MKLGGSIGFAISFIAAEYEGTDRNGSLGFSIDALDPLAQLGQFGWVYACKICDFYLDNVSLIGFWVLCLEGLVGFDLKANQVKLCGLW